MNARRGGFALVFGEGVVLIVLSAISVNYACPRYVDADQIMYSLMSLRHLTLFYWAQNRLANVLPLLAVPLRDPEANLFACLVIANLFFFGLLLAVAKYISVRLHDDSEGRADLNHRLVFALMVGGVVLMFNTASIDKIGAHHYEYTFSPLCAFLAYWITVRQKNPAKYVYSAILLFVATGVNYGVVLIVLAMVVVTVLADRHRVMDIVAFCATGVAAFATWRFLSRLSADGNAKYWQFNLINIDASITRAATNLLVGVRPEAALIVLVVAPAVAMLLAARQDRQLQSRESRLAVLGAVAFSAAWLLVFSNNQWVQMNGYAFRYFIPAILAVFGVATYGLCRAMGEVCMLARCNQMAQNVLAIVILAVVAVSLYRPFVPPRDYAALRQVDDLPAGQVHLYAGDYWQVWPAVMRDMMERQESFGLADRAVGDREGLERFLESNALFGKTVAIGCMNAKVDECLAQAREWLGDVAVKSTRPMKGHISIIDVTVPVPTKS